MTLSGAVLLLEQRDPPRPCEGLEKVWIWCQEAVKVTRQASTICRLLLSKIPKNAKKMKMDI